MFSSIAPRDSCVARVLSVHPAPVGRALSGDCGGGPARLGGQSPPYRGPVDRVDRDAERRGLDERPYRERHTQSQDELVELAEEQGGDHGGRRVTTTAEERRASEHDHRYGGQEVRVALECSWLVG